MHVEALMIETENNEGNLKAFEHGGDKREDLLKLLINAEQNYQ